VVAAGIAGTDFIARTIFSPHPARRELEISPLVIVLSVFFWPLVLGVPGLFLAVPLMLFAKAVFGAHEETCWLAVRWDRPITMGSPGDAPDRPPAPLSAEPYPLHLHTPIMRPHGIAGGSPQKVYYTCNNNPTCRDQWSN